MEERVFESWQVKELLGEGSFGKVYRIEREDFGAKYEAALKKIVIPQSPKEVSEAVSEGMDEESVTRYFRTFVEEIVSEFQLMSRLKGHTNIVSYEDHKVIAHEDGIGWDVLIRMELLTSLADAAAGKPLKEKEVIKLGRDICQALEVCQRYDIIHRDIKPENIFVSELGDYKLGDFGIARTAEKTMSNLSKKGTYNYMAPEVYKGEAYGPSVDIYSLGIVMYRFLNNNRMPFLPPFPEPISYSNRESAIAKRMAGEEFPAPCNGSKELKQIVLKACAYRPEDRYASPEEMRLELEKLTGAVQKEAFVEQSGPVFTVLDDDNDKTISAMPPLGESTFKEDATVSALHERMVEKETEKATDISQEFSKRETVSMFQEFTEEEEKTVSIFREMPEEKKQPELVEKTEDNKKETSNSEDKVPQKGNYGIKIIFSYLFIISGFLSAMMIISDNFTFIDALMRGSYFRGVIYNYMYRYNILFILAVVSVTLTFISGIVLLIMNKTKDKLPAGRKKVILVTGLLADIIMLGRVVYRAFNPMYYIYLRGFYVAFIVITAVIAAVLIAGIVTTKDTLHKPKKR